MADEAEVEDRLNEDAGTVQVPEDFRNFDLRRTLEDLYGEEGADNILAAVNQQVSRDTQGESTIDDLDDGTLISRIALNRHFAEGPSGSDEFLRAVSTSGEPEEEEEVGPPPRRAGATDGRGAAQNVMGLSTYLRDTFGQDTAMKGILTQVEAEMLGRTVTDRIGNVDGLDPVTVTPVAFMQRVKQKVREAEARLDQPQFGGVSREQAGFGEPSSDALFDAILEEYESGRSDLPSDHELRDPSGLIKPIEEANDSPRIRDIAADERLALKEIKFQDPNILFGVDDMGAQELAAYTKMLRENPRFLQGTDETKMEMIRDFTVQATARAVNFAWEAGTLKDASIQSEFGATPVFNRDSKVFSKEIFEKSYQNTLQKDLAEAFGAIEVGGPRTDSFNPTEGGGFVLGNIVNIIKTAVGEAQKQAEFDADPRAARLKSGNEVGAEAAYDYFYKMSDKDFRKVQLGAFNAGAYGDKSIEEIRFGDRNDGVAFRQWDNAINESARSALLGQKVDIHQILDIASFDGKERRRRAVQEERDTLEALKNQVSSAPNLATITVSDPLAIAATADSLAQRLLGRNATAAEQKLLTSLVQGQQRENQASQIRRTQAANANSLQNQIAEAERAVAGLEDGLEFDFERDQIISESVTDAEVLGAEDLFTGGNNALGEITQRIGSREGRIQEARERNNIPTPGQPQPAAGGGGLQDTQITQVTDFDANAFMANYLKKNNETEFETKGLREGFNNFLGVLGQPVGGI